MSEKVYCRFHIAQHSKDIKLSPRGARNYSLNFLRPSYPPRWGGDSGVVHLRSNTATPRCDFIVQDTASLLDKIIPHFDLYPLLNLGLLTPKGSGGGAGPLARATFLNVSIVIDTIKNYKKIIFVFGRNFTG